MGGDCDGLIPAHYAWAFTGARRAIAVASPTGHARPAEEEKVDEGESVLLLGQWPDKEGVDWSCVDQMHELDEVPG